jgi:hypothetical protein
MRFSAERSNVPRTEAPNMAQIILAGLDRPETARSVLAAAALVAPKFGLTHIAAPHLRHDTFEGFMPTEEVMSEQRQQKIKAAAAQDSIEMRNIFDVWSNEAGIRDWVEVIGETAKVASQAEVANADLVIIGRAPDGYPTMTSTRGKCAGKAPRLRFGSSPADGLVFLIAASSPAIFSATDCSRSSVACSVSSVSFSDRRPKRLRRRPAS